MVDNVFLIVDLPRPGEEPVVRFAPGIVAIGPQWSRAMHLVETELHQQKLIDFRSIDGRSQVSMPMGKDWEVWSVDRDGVQIRMGKQHWWMNAVKAEFQPIVPNEQPGGLQHWRGPRSGFSLKLQDAGELALFLPRSEEINELFI